MSFYGFFLGIFKNPDKISIETRLRIALTLIQCSAEDRLSPVRLLRPLDDPDDVVVTLVP